MVNEPKHFNDLTQHIILFSKHWYGRTHNVVDDLATFMHKWSGMDKSVYTERELMRIMATVFSDCATPHMVFEFINGIAFPSSRFFPPQRETMSLKQMLESMLGLIGTLQVKKSDESGKFYTLIELPSLEPKYMITGETNCQT